LHGKSVRKKRLLKISWKQPLRIWPISGVKEPKVPMPIKFDTLAELKAFYQAFTLSEKSSEDLPTPFENLPLPKKRGRKPGAKNIVSSATDITPKKRGRKPGTKNIASGASDITPKKRGRKPGEKNIANSAIDIIPKKRGPKPGAKNIVSSAIGIIPKKRGPKPGAKNIVSSAIDIIPKKRGPKPGAKNIASATTDITPKKRGRKPGAVVTQQPALKTTRTLTKATTSPGKPGRKPATAKGKATSSKKES
jgi:ribosomal protein S7